MICHPKSGYGLQYRVQYTIAVTAEAAAEALGVWTEFFGSTEWLVADQGSHLKSDLLSKLTAEAGVRHHFVTLYCL